MPTVLVCMFAGVIALNSSWLLAAQAAARPGMPARSVSATMHEPTPAREQGPIVTVAPAPSETLQDALTAILRWDREKEGAVHAPVELTVSTRPDFIAPIVQTRLDRSAIDYRLTLLPSTHYYWKVVPVRDGKRQPQSAAASDFISGAPRNEDKAGDALRYRNPRIGAHWGLETVVPFRQAEPLSPWFDRRSYNTAPPPKFSDVKGDFPVPVWDGHRDAIDAYWYCWKTLLDVWTFAPSARDHQAVSNMIGLRSWSRWGSTMVWDTAFILHFARYGNQAYPFITGLDNCYGRQHENGFICREADRENRETYVIFPLNPPLFAWAEWEYYKISGDKDRLARVLLPIVRHYEWWMTYQRRANGVYWTNGFNEADDSPRNQVAYSCVSATAYQALAALCLAHISDTVGRKDLAQFFRQEHASLGRLINKVFWDQKHGIYNDLARDGKFITELEPGVFCKHAHMFWPLIAEVTPGDRVDLVVGEIMNPKTFYRRNGIASLSGDSKDFNTPTGQYWRGAVWPPIQCMVQEGLKANGRMDQAGALALRYQRSVVDVFNKEHDITENLAPDEPRGYGVGQFVGWGGIGPISNLIEYVLGFDIESPKKTITWRIHNNERHGLTHFKLGDFHVDLICNQRHSETAPCRVHVTSGGHFTLTLVAHGKTVEKQIAPGEHELSMD